VSAVCTKITGRPLSAAERTGPGSICLTYVRRAPDPVMRTETLREQLAAAQSAAFPFAAQQCLSAVYSMSLGRLRFALGPSQAVR
jgi:hypothetical protein